MVKKVLTVFDSKSGVYLPPMQWVSVGAALRDIADSATPESPIGKHPADFTIFELGEFEDTTGAYSLLDAKKNHGTVQELLGKTETPKRVKAV